jgi:hypothetical protein
MGNSVDVTLSYDSYSEITRLLTGQLGERGDMRACVLHGQVLRQAKVGSGSSRLLNTRDATGCHDRMTVAVGFVVASGVPRAISAVLGSYGVPSVLGSAAAAAQINPCASVAGDRFYDEASSICVVHWRHV